MCCLFDRLTSKIYSGIQFFVRVAVRDIGANVVQLMLNTMFFHLITVSFHLDEFFVFMASKLWLTKIPTITLRFCLDSPLGKKEFKNA